GGIAVRGHSISRATSPMDHKQSSHIYPPRSALTSKADIRVPDQTHDSLSVGRLLSRAAASGQQQTLISDETIKVRHAQVISASRPVHPIVLKNRWPGRAFDRRDDNDEGVTFHRPSRLLSREFKHCRRLSEGLAVIHSPLPPAGARHRGSSRYGARKRGTGGSGRRSRTPGQCRQRASPWWPTCFWPDRRAAL